MTFVGEILEVVGKHLQKSNKGVILHYISLPIYSLLFPKFCSIQKQEKTLRNDRYLVKTTLVVNLIVYKIIFFETFIVFLEPTIKVITRILDL